MKLMLALVAGWFCGLLTASLVETSMSGPMAYSRACLPGDECTMIIKPKDAPWLNITCELTAPVRCRDGEPK